MRPSSGGNEGMLLRLRLRADKPVNFTCEHRVEGERGCCCNVCLSGG